MGLWLPLFFSRPLSLGILLINPVRPVDRGLETFVVKIQLITEN